MNFKNFLSKKETKMFIALFCIICIFYRGYMGPQYISMDYKKTILKINNKEYNVRMKIEGEKVRTQFFSNSFSFEGSLNIYGETALLKNSFTKGKLSLSKNPRYNKTMFFGVLENKNNLDQVLCSSNFKKIYIYGDNYEIYSSKEVLSLLKNVRAHSK